ncbi:MAG: hypothetical protein VX617_04015 [Pseudomonadota bacterium]|nr:hypothetical protein [Pseudomonadota bacterium]
MMRTPVIISTTLHVVIFVVAVLGLPKIQRPIAMEEVPIVVELLPVKLETKLPSQNNEKNKQIELNKIEKESNSKIKPMIKTSSTSPPAPAATRPSPPEKKIKPKLSPKKKVVPKKKDRLLKKLAKLKPRRKPVPPDPFELVLKNIAKNMKVKKKTAVDKSKEKSVKPDFEQQITRVLSEKRVSESNAAELSVSERHAMINTIRRAIKPCWNIQPGAKGAEDIVVVIGASLSPDGRVTRAWVKNRAFLSQDPFKLSAAETAQRAILNQACQPFKLDPKQYAVWKTVELNFNPSEMFGR